MGGLGGRLCLSFGGRGVYPGALNPLRLRAQEIQHQARGARRRFYLPGRFSWLALRSGLHAEALRREDSGPALP